MPTSTRAEPVAPDLPTLTGLRWIAAFVVFAFHARNVGYFDRMNETIVTILFGAGATGVSLFFVLSGFVLAWSHRDDDRPTRFWLRRVARIYPLHVVGVALALIVATTLFPAIITRDPAALLANLALVSSWRSDWWQAGNPVSWTLVCEAFFYLAFPLLVVAMRRVGRTGLTVIASLAALAAIGMPAIVAASALPVSAATFPVARLPEFVVGMSLALLMRRGGWRGPALVPSAIVALAGYALASLEPASPYAVAGMTIVGFGLLVAALARAHLEGRARWLASGPMVALGRISFAFYLSHLLVLQAIFGALPTGRFVALDQQLLTAGVALSVAVVLALGLHLLVEEPAKRQFLTPPSTTPSGRGGRRVGQRSDIAVSRAARSFAGPSSMTASRPRIAH